MTSAAPEPSRFSFRLDRLGLTGDITVPEEIILSHPNGRAMAKVVSVEDGIITLETDDPAIVDFLRVSGPASHYSSSWD